MARLPEMVTAYRAHRPAEKDWIAYTISIERATFFAAARKVDEISEYVIPRDDILALFLRRGEFEILVPDQFRVRFVRKIKVIQVKP